MKTTAARRKPEKRNYIKNCCDDWKTRGKWRGWTDFKFMRRYSEALKSGTRVSTEAMMHFSTLSKRLRQENS